MSEETNAIESSESIASEVEAIEQDVHTDESIDMSASDAVEEESQEASGEEPSEAEVKDAAKEVKAKEVKGSDGELFKVKIDGVEEELTKDQLIRYAQMGKSGQKAMQERAELRKSIESFIEALKANPESVLEEDLGLNMDEIAQRRLARRLEEEALSPEEKERRALKKELEEIKSRYAKEKEEQERAAYESEVAKYEAELETQVTEAFEKHQLPKKPIFLSRMADLLEEAYSRNLNVTPVQIAAAIKEDWLNETKSALGAFDDDALESMLGSEIVSRLRKSQLKKVKAAPSIKTKPTVEAIKADEKPKEFRKMSMKDFLSTSLVNKK